jgi:large subunit ribosomal protein L30
MNMAKKKEQTKTIKVTLVRSPIGYEKSQGATVRSLGLRKLNSSVVVPDNDAVRGMVYKVRHLVMVEESE